MAGGGPSAADPAPTPAVMLGQRLDHLFNTIPSPSGKWTNVEMSQHLADRGVAASPTYIAMIRKGQRASPNSTLISSMAAIFGVPTAYFYDDDVAQKLNHDLELLVAIRRAGTEKIAMRASGLSPQGIKEVGRIIDAVRRMEGLDDAEPEDADR